MIEAAPTSSTESLEALQRSPDALVREARQDQARRTLLLLERVEVDAQIVRTADL